MVSNLPYLFKSSADIPANSETSQVEALGERVLDRIREAVCGLYGHDTMRVFERNRLFLKCVSCGHESPGWSINETPAQKAESAQKAETESRRGVASTRLISERKIA